jgi:hypothetical protein
VIRILIVKVIAERDIEPFQVSITDSMEATLDGVPAVDMQPALST